MQTNRLGLVVLCALFAPVAVPGCDKGGDTKNDDATVEKGPGSDSSSKNAEGEPASKKAVPLKEERIRTKEICDELFAPKDVAETSGLDVAGLEMNAHMKGMCGIGSGSSPLRLALTITFVKEKLEDAEFHFDNMTKSKTEADIKADLVRIAEQAEERDPSHKVDLEAIAAMVAKTPAMNYVDVDGVGDRARMMTLAQKVGDKTETDCTIRVLVRNMSFSLTVSGKSLSKEATIAAAKTLAASLGDKISKM